MPGQNGRDFLLKIGNGGSPETFTAIGAARITSMIINNALTDNTSLDSGGAQAFQEAGGLQSMTITLDGIFRDEAAEETLRAAAFAAAVKNYQLAMPNGDVYAAAFVVRDYRRSGDVDALEEFSATMLRSGGGTFTPGA